MRRCFGGSKAPKFGAAGGAVTLTQTTCAIMKKNKGPADEFGWDKPSWYFEDTQELEPHHEGVDSILDDIDYGLAHGDVRFEVFRRKPR